MTQDKINYLQECCLRMYEAKTKFDVCLEQFTQALNTLDNDTELKHNQDNCLIIDGLSIDFSRQRNNPEQL